MRIIRVFPRKTNASPIDDLAYFGPPDLVAEADEIHISVLFTYDLKRAELLEKKWKYVAPVKMGGPAFGMKGGDFIPGKYVKKGYIITSRGCPNNCWFCSVWKREGREIRELPITEGYHVLDDNLLACSDNHIKAVFAMLKKQKKSAIFGGGFEATRLKPWIVEALKDLHPKQMFFAYDTPDDLEPLRKAGRMLLEAGFTRASHALRCYVLCGYPKDTIDAALQRMKETIDAGFTPMAMVWRNKEGLRSSEWMKFQKKWSRPAIIHSNQKSVKKRKGFGF